MYLVDKIIEKCEYHSANDWKNGATGNRTVLIEQKDYKKCGKTQLVEEVRELLQRDLIKVKSWVVYGSDPAAIMFCVQDLPRFYVIAKEEADAKGENFVSKQQRVIRCREQVNKELNRGISKQWIADYYHMLLGKIEELGAGRIPKEFDRLELDSKCLRGLDELEEPMYERIFSKKYLGNTKAFQKNAKSHIISIAKTHCPEVEKDMDDTTVLEQIFIWEYAQEMALKGPLRLKLCFESESRNLNVEDFYYGMILNTETLKHIEIESEQPAIHRIVTVENKANFVSVPYEEDTLYVFSHGYFSPYERKFLQKLYQILEQRQDVSYHHSGDLDYGGVKIFEYIQHRIFPKLQPMLMDVETFEKYREYAEPIEEQKLEKLKETKIPILQDLIEKMIGEGMGIEQESFLIERVQ